MDGHPFKVFIDLINFDQAIRATQEDITRFEQAVAEIKIQEKGLVETLERAKQNVVTLRKQVDEQELEIKDLDEKEREKKKLLQDSAHYKSYKPLKKEIDALKEKQLQAEELLMNLWNKLEAAQKELDSQQKMYDQKIEELHAACVEKEEKISSLQADLKQRIKQRPEKEALMPEEWLSKYQHMRMQVSDPVVEVLQESCSACSYSVPAQDLSRLKRRALVQCKGCFRLLYSQEAMDEAA